MSDPSVRQCVAFEGSRLIASGTLADVALKAKEVFNRDRWASVLILDAATSELVEMDLGGTADDVRKSRAEAPQAEEAALPRGPGRPKLGVVAREVTLLPRHWEWLGRQPGGASVALRKLVEEARRSDGGRDRVRQSQEAAYRFMSAVAGNLPGFEEATRALFAGDRRRFDELVEPWPAGARDHARTLAVVALEGPAAEASAGPVRP
jgi:hypothetical protein